MSRSSLSRTITYLRQCYQADNRALVITDFAAKKVKHTLWLEGEEQLLTGFYPYHGLPAGYSEELGLELQLNQQQETVILGALPLVGRLAEPLQSSKTLCAPLVIFPTELDTTEEGVCYRISFERRQLNHFVLRALLPEAKYPAIDEFEELLPRGALTHQIVGDVLRWFNQHLPEVDADGALLYPQRMEKDEITSLRKSRKETVRLVSAVGMGVVARSQETLGILSETDTLSQLPPNQFSAPLRQLLDPTPMETISEPPLHPAQVPASLNDAQQRALHNARHHALSLIQGPPGTGKSFTIANMALDLFSRGQQVLIVTRNQEALEVIAEKIEALVPDPHIMVHTGKGNYLRAFMQRVRWLMAQGKSKRKPSPKKAKAKELAPQIEQQKAKVAKAYTERSATETDRSLWLAPPYPEGYSRWAQSWQTLKTKFYRYRLGRSEGLWKLTRALHGFLQQWQKAMGTLLAERYQQRIDELAPRTPQLRTFLKALKSRNLAESKDYFHQTDFSLVTRWFPIWLVSLNDLYRNLPLNAELFDVVVMDEATQCDITTALPALQRAKRAVVVGDLYQLRHVSFLAGDRQRRLAEQLGLPYGQLPDYRNESLLDLALRQLTSGYHVVMLQEHYRSHPSIIGFSNRQFYQSQLHIMTKRPYPQPTQVHTLSINGKRNSKGVNEQEAEAIIDKVEALVAAQASLPHAEVHTIGILSPFAAQADHLRKQVANRLEWESVKRHQIQVGTPYSFQGAERDEMYISLAIDADTHPSVFPYLNRADMFNVAITRARDRQYVFFSATRSDLNAESLLAQYLHYIEVQEAADPHQPPEADPFLQQVLEALQAKGYTLWPHFLLAGILVDVVVTHPNGATVGLDLLGGPGVYGQGLPVDQLDTLHRSGLPIFTLPYTRWSLQPEKCLSALAKMLDVN